MVKMGEPTDKRGCKTNPEKGENSGQEQGQIFLSLRAMLQNPESGDGQITPQLHPAVPPLLHAIPMRSDRRHGGKGVPGAPWGHTESTDLEGWTLQGGGQLRVKSSKSWLSPYNTPCSVLRGLSYSGHLM